MAVFRGMRKFRHRGEEEYAERVLTSFEEGRFPTDRLGAAGVVDPDRAVVLLDLRRRLIDEYFMRVTGGVGSLSIHIEHEFLGLDGPSADFRDRYGQEGRAIRGLSVGERLAHLRERG